MGLNLYNIKKWTKMIAGKSILHVDQGVGKCYTVDKVAGYYNDLTEKVIKGEAYNKVIVPQIKIENGQMVYFPIAVFQYGLGAYDLYLMSKDKLFLDKFKKMLEWTIDNQKEDGSFSNFYYIYPDNPYSSMAQGEAASLLVRGYMLTGELKYLKRAQLALEFMLKPIESGGTCEYKDKDVYLKEYTHKPVVLNGWIFSIFGLYDFLLAANEETNIEKLIINNMKKSFELTVDTLSRVLERYDNGYWSLYDTTSMIASPFYHKLHIAQLKVLTDITERAEFSTKAEQFETYLVKRTNRTRAFVIKAYQKLRE